MVKLFASHDWGADGANHQRVVKVATALRAAGFSVWLDETHMRGNIVDAMCQGIRDSDIVLVFVTRNYMNKVASMNERDNCKREFTFADQQGKKMIPIRFDAGLPNRWTGPLGMVLGAHLYVDLADDAETVAPLIARIQKESQGQVLWKRAHRKAPVLRVTRPPPTDNMDSVRGRVRSIIQEMGDTPDPEEHVGQTVSRLSKSLGLGEMNTLKEKICSIEHELHLNRANSM